MVETDWWIIFLWFFFFFFFLALKNNENFYRWIFLDEHQNVFFPKSKSDIDPTFLMLILNFSLKILTNLSEFV